MRTVAATRYLTPLREGGSLPAIVEADDDGLYVLKFRGAGQGPKALIAELVAGEIARALGLPVPEIVFMQLDTELARTEPDPEIQDLMRASGGLNLALDYLPGALAYDPLTMPIDEALASRIVWLDALVGNVDRSARNTNLLWWHGSPWLIDHGAALVFQHQWDGCLQRSRNPFAPIADHVLLPRANALAEADAQLVPRLTPECIAAIVAMIPDAWLDGQAPFAGRDAERDAYRLYFDARLRAPRAFADEARDAHARL
ncbi:MAG TPA: aminotransferase class I and II [Rubrivivax sp.]|nr:aminotransferase class I and II [Rubrivivax sp.]